MAGLWCSLLPLLLAGLTSAVIHDVGWWRNTVFYQIYPRSFMDGNNDGTGDLMGITSKLKHFTESGIGAIWLSPIYSSPMVDFGYDIQNFTEIDEIFGNMTQFEELVERAKELGIKVILDFVPNHTSDDHEWFQKSIQNDPEYADFYVWSDGHNGTAPPNNWISVFSGSAWTYNTHRRQWYLHQFHERMPDLNYKNPAVRAAMEKVITFWLDKGVDGFRVDAAPHIYENDTLEDEPLSGVVGSTPRDYDYLDHIYTKDDQRTYDLVNSWRALLDEYANRNNQSEKILMVEAYTNLKNTTKYYNAGAHIPFNFQFIMDVNKSSTAEAFNDTINKWLGSMPEYATANWVMGNHDRSRTATRYPGRADQMTMLAMILPGVAITYNGEEIGMVDKYISWEETQDPRACNAGREKFEKETRDPNRTPFQWDDSVNAGFSTANSTWLPIHENYKSLNLASQKVAVTSRYKVYRTLTNLRATSKALIRGRTKTAVLNNGNILAVTREYDEDFAILVINFSESESQLVDLTEQISQNVSHAAIKVANVESAISARFVTNLKEVDLPARGSAVLTPYTMISDGYSISPVKAVLIVAIALKFALS